MKIYKIGIYKVTSPTGRIYIGQSVNIDKRFTGYRNMNVKNQGQTKLHRSFLKHGSKNHKFEIIEECLEEELNEKERYWQEFYDVLNGGLNCKLTKTDDRSGKVSEESRLKMSISQKNSKYKGSWLGKKHSQETKDKISKHRLGSQMSEETKKKISDSLKGCTSPMKGVFSENNSNSKPIVQLTLEGDFVRNWYCLADIRREIGYSIGSISQVANGKAKTAYKFKWVFLKDYTQKITK